MTQTMPVSIALVKLEAMDIRGIYNTLCLVKEFNWVVKSIYHHIHSSTIHGLPTVFNGNLLISISLSATDRNCS